MADLLDIAPASAVEAVHLGEARIVVRGISINTMAGIIARFPDLKSLASGDGGDMAAFTITQGVEMGRPSLLKVASWRAEDGYHSRVGGNCTPMFRGEALL